MKMNLTLTPIAGTFQPWARIARRAVALGVMTVAVCSAHAQIAISTYAGQAGAIGSTNAPSGPPTSATFNNPEGIAIDGTYLYIADSGNNTIRRITLSSGVVATLASGFGSPAGVAVDTAGDLFVADTTNHVIRKVTSSGTVSLVAGQAGTSGNTNAALTASTFFNRSGVAVNGAGTIVYVADTGNSLIRKVDISANLVTTIGGTAGSSGLAN